MRNSRESQFTPILAERFGRIAKNEMRNIAEWSLSEYKIDTK
jgi:hypothetical protein